MEIQIAVFWIVVHSDVVGHQRFEVPCYSVVHRMHGILTHHYAATTTWTKSITWTHNGEDRVCLATFFMSETAERISMTKWSKEVAFGPHYPDLDRT